MYARGARLQVAHKDAVSQRAERGDVGAQVAVLRLPQQLLLACRPATTLELS